MTENRYVFYGKALVFGDNVDTDAILPTKYLNLTDEKEIASHCMEDFDPGFTDRVRQGDILIAGNNFGCGSSREHAPVAIMGSGVACIIAKSFSRLFYRNSINIGLPLIIADIMPSVADGDEICADCTTGKITIQNTGKVFAGAPLPQFMLNILDKRGLTGYLSERLKELGRL